MVTDLSTNKTRHFFLSSIDEVYFEVFINAGIDRKSVNKKKSSSFTEMRMIYPNPILIHTQKEAGRRCQQKHRSAFAKRAQYLSRRVLFPFA